MQQKILIIGAGAMGTALGNVLSKNENNQIQYWDSDSKKITHNQPFKKLVQDAQMIFLCVESWNIKDVAESLVRYTNDTTLIIALTKGIEQTTGYFVPRFLAEYFRSEQIGMLCGPMLAGELQKGLASKAIIAGSDNLCRTAMDIFKGTRLYLETTQDTHSVAITSVLKNIYAVAFGIATALNMGSNFKGVLTTQALEEMHYILTQLGGDGSFAYNLAGIGDLVTTGHSPLSRNRAFGERLVKKGERLMASEGAVSFMPLLNMLGERSRDLILLKTLESVLVQKNDPVCEFIKIIQNSHKNNNGKHDF